MEKLEINNRMFSVSWELSRNRNAWARLKGETIVISLPSRWPKSERKEIGEKLLKRVVRSIERGKWKPEDSKRIEFSHGQRLIALGKEFEIVFIPSERFGSRKVKAKRVEVEVVEDHRERDRIVSDLVRKRIVEALMPSLMEKINSINDEHFNAELKKVSIRDNVTRWGSYTRKGAMSLNFRLLFLPDDILEYVIVHELAHSRYLSHGVRFWKTVEKVVPDHMKRRKWLRENGWKFPPENSKPKGQQKIIDFLEC